MLCAVSRLRGRRERSAGASVSRVLALPVAYGAGPILSAAAKTAAGLSPGAVQPAMAYQMFMNRVEAVTGPEPGQAEVAAPSSFTGE